MASPIGGAAPLFKSRKCGEIAIVKNTNAKV
jgi:hypothetical protein